MKKFIFLTLLFFTTNTMGQTKLSHIENYLNSLVTLKARFDQWDQAGKHTQGILLLKRPGYLRMTYDKPETLLIIADGKTLYFINEKNKDISYTPIEQSPASFLLESKIDFLHAFDIKDFREDVTRVYLTIRRKGMPDLGALTLTFSKSPLELIHWTIHDAQGLETLVKLSQLQKGVPLSVTYFDPSPYFGG